MAQFGSLARRLGTGLMHLVYPNSCWTCGLMLPPEGQSICTACHARLTTDPFATCPRCSSTVGPHLDFRDGCPECRSVSFSFDGVFRMAPYEGLLREAILRTKQWTGEDLAEILGQIWAAKMRDRLAATGADVVVPIPLHWRRRWRRGFNQSEIFARCLGQQLNIPCLTRVLSRRRATPHQYTQTSMAARRENVKHAFFCHDAASLAGKTILLVDDILTSGATASEAAKVMRAAKPKAIFVTVLAHGR